MPARSTRFFRETRSEVDVGMALLSMLFVLTSTQCVQLQVAARAELMSKHARKTEG